MNSSILLKLIKFGIGFILFIPLYIGGSFFFPFIFPKIWLFQLVIEVILFLYIILARADARFRPKWNLALGATVLLTTILIITSFTGVDAFRSFWGNSERMSGVIAWFHFVAFAIILAGVLKTEKEWRNFFGIAVIVSVLEFFYVLAQYLGASWVWLPHSQIGTIGNADLLGSYAIFSAFFALYLWKGLNIDVRHQSFPDVGHQYFWAAAFFLNMGTLYLAGSRGAMLGFGAGIFVFMLSSIWQNKNNLKIWAIIAGCLIAVYGVLFMARDTDFVENNYQLRRITHISIQDTTVQQRFTEWGIAFEAFKARPFFGFGPNNYLYLHNAFLNPRVYNLQETNFDRAHNAYLDYASMSGIVGLLGYIFLIGVLFWVFWKNKLWIPASLMIAYAIQSFFVFDSPASYIALFLTIGFAMFVANSKSEIPNTKYQIQNTNFSFQTIIASSFIAFLLLFCIFWQVSIKPAVANNEFVRAFNNPSLSAEESFDLYKKALAQETLGTTEFRNQYVSWLQRNLGNFKPEKQMAVLDFGISELEKEIKDHPAVFSYMNLGQLYNYKARGFQNESAKREFFEHTANTYDRALELSPSRLEVYYSYLQLSFDTKNYSKGIELMKKAVEINPTYPQNLWYLGFAYINGGNDIEAVNAINRSLLLWYRGLNITIENGRLKYDLNEVLKSKNNFAQKNEILGAVNPYIRLKMWPELLLLYLSAEAGDPEDIQLHQSLALVYQNLGLTDKVNEELKIVETLSENQSKSE
ncbi:MAG: O-antigen ligase family protein [Patescibacteria group bacterium]